MNPEKSTIMTRNTLEIIRPELTREEALKLVKIIKSGSDYSGVLVMKSLANTLRYVQYTKVEKEIKT